MKVSPQEAKRRDVKARQRRALQANLRAAFTDGAMLDHARLVVWTKGQMAGIRATLLRLGCSA